MQIILILLVLLFPIVAFWVYLKSVKAKSRKIIDFYTTNSSEWCRNLKVWTKNFDTFKKKELFDLDIYDTTYGFNDCDVMLNPENFIVIGKGNFLGKQWNMMPIIFRYRHDTPHLRPYEVLCEAVKEVGQDLEITFVDKRYLPKMTFVIKRADKKLKERIQTDYKKTNT